MSTAPQLPVVSVILVNYNGRIFLPECLKSLSRNAPGCEILVVDNGSTDGSLADLDRWPAVTLLRNGANLGFARACNLGVASSAGEFVLLLNYDARLEGGLEQAIAHLLQNPGSAAVGGGLAYPDGRFQPSVGYEHSPARLLFSWMGLGLVARVCSLFSREILEPSWYRLGHTGVDWVSGALMLIRRSDWDDVKGMDPAFFLYLEDVDFCARLRAAGRRVDFRPELNATHLNCGGAAVVSQRALLSTVDSVFHYVRKRSGNHCARATCMGLGTVFTLRGLLLPLRIRRGADAAREGRVFLKAAWRAFRIAGGKMYPWGAPC